MYIEELPNSTYDSETIKHEEYAGEKPSIDEKIGCQYNNDTNQPITTGTFKPFHFND